MGWDDDSWRDGYDAWKLRSSDDYYEDEPDECDHQEYEVDIVVGRAHCCTCPHSWWQTNEEIAAEVARIREYDEWQRREHAREAWRQLTAPIRWLWYRMLMPFSPRSALKSLHDDEIPF